MSYSFTVKQINLHNQVLYSDLSIPPNVSDEMVRRYLYQLAEKGELLKVHGGAISKSFHNPYHGDNVYIQYA